MIESIKDIQKLVVAGFDDWRQCGHVYTKEKGDLILFNYLNEAQYEGTWTFFERVSRGLIINKKTGEIVARPFDKFFNWGEHGQTSDSPIRSITEKLDGSLGILYRDNGFKIATRGSFDSEQAQWATKFLNNHYDLIGLNDNLTLLFEIIYPENRIVIDYQGKEDLYLIGAIQRYTGQQYSYEHLDFISRIIKFPLPKRYDFQDIQTIIEKLDELPYNNEGWVVEFEDGQRFKFKGKEYLKVHKIIHNISFKNTLAAYIDGKVDEILAVIPDEFIPEVEAHIQQIKLTIKDTEQKVEELFSAAPKTSRKDFALWVTSQHKEYAPYLFTRLDNKPLLPLIYKLAFKENE